MPKRWVERPPGSNWGEFGENDERGRMNLVTPERRLAGIREVTEGITFQLSLPLDVPAAGMSGGMRLPPQRFSRNAEGRALFPEYLGGDIALDDGVVLYLQHSTQWDSLAHVGRHFDADGDGIAEAVFYNGFRLGEHIVPPDAGGPNAKRLGIDKMAETAVQGRGVLVDLTRIDGPRPLAVTYGMLMHELDRQRVEIAPGDFLLLHTGLDRLLLANPAVPDLARAIGQGIGLDGTDLKLQRWIDESGVVAICSDNPAVEAIQGMQPHPDGGETMMPLHQHCLFRLGIHFGEYWYLAELADWLAAHDRHAFLLTAPPLRMPGAVGSPVTPVATV